MGATVHEIQDQTRTDIKINQDTKEAGYSYAIVTSASANEADLNEAERLINDKIGVHTSSVVGAGNSGMNVKELRVDDFCVGGLIGKGGEHIKVMTSEAGCKIQIDQKGNGQQARVTIGPGSAEQIEKAEKMVNDKCEEIKKSRANAANNTVVPKVMGTPALLNLALPRAPLPRVPAPPGLMGGMLALPGLPGGAIGLGTSPALAAGTAGGLGKAILAGILAGQGGKAVPGLGSPGMPGMPGMQDCRSPFGARVVPALRPPLHRAPLGTFPGLGVPGMAMGAKVIPALRPAATVRMPVGMPAGMFGSPGTTAFSGGALAGAFGGKGMCGKGLNGLGTALLMNAKGKGKAGCGGPC